MSAFAVAAFHDARLALGAGRVEAVVSILATGLGEPAVEVLLRLWTPLGATVEVLREIAPDGADLLGAAIRRDDQTVEYPAGRWSDGVHEYELAVAPPAREAGDEMLAARLGVVAGGQVAGSALIAVTWADVATADLPTGPSAQPRHMLDDDALGGNPCAGCGLSAADGDRFCECCGRELAR